MKANVGGFDQVLRIMVGLVLVIMTIGVALTLLYQGGTESATFLRLLPAVYLIYLSLALTTALALVFSTFSTPMLSAAFTFALFIAGRFSTDLRNFNQVTDAPFDVGVVNCKMHEGGAVQHPDDAGRSTS